MSYVLRIAVSALWRERLINFLCTLTIASGIFLMSFSFLVVSNLGGVARKLPERFAVMVFLKDGLPTEAVKELILSVRKLEGVKKARYISREEALGELRAALEDSEYILEGLDENPLPASIELKLGSRRMTEEGVGELAREIRKLEGVEEVQYGARLLSIIQSVNRYSEAMGFLLIAVLSTGVVFVCYTTVKILFYGKQSEIDTLKLLGATKGFIRAPFLLEGSIIGFSGGLISAAGMFSLYYFGYLRLAESFPLVRGLEMPVWLLGCPPAAGLLIGLVGSKLAIGRIRF